MKIDTTSWTLQQHIADQKKKGGYDANHGRASDEMDVSYLSTTRFLLFITQSLVFILSCK